MATGVSKTTEISDMVTFRQLSLRLRPLPISFGPLTPRTTASSLLIHQDLLLIDRESRWSSEGSFLSSLAVQIKTMFPAIPEFH